MAVTSTTKFEMLVENPSIDDINYVNFLDTLVSSSIENIAYEFANSGYIAGLSGQYFAHLTVFVPVGSESQITTAINTYSAAESTNIRYWTTPVTFNN